MGKWTSRGREQVSQDHFAENCQLEKIWLAYHALPNTLGIPNSVKTSIGFSRFQLVHGVESILPIEREIPSLLLEVSLLPDTSDLEQRLVHLESLNEQCQDASMVI
jgi:hypothetical protein